MASSPCGPFPHSESALRDPHAARPAQPGMRLQHAWSAPGALQDDSISISLSPSTPTRPQHALHQMPQERVYAETPTNSLGGYPPPEHSMLRFPAPEMPGVAPRRQPTAAPQEVHDAVPHGDTLLPTAGGQATLRLSSNFWVLRCLGSALLSLQVQMICVQGT